jgi:hypothetical protein
MKQAGRMEQATKGSRVSFGRSEGSSNLRDTEERIVTTFILMT